MSQISIHLTDEAIATLSDETREILFDAVRHAVNEIYMSKTGTDADIDIENIEYNIAVIGHTDTPWYGDGIGDGIDDDDIEDAYID